MQALTNAISGAAKEIGTSEENLSDEFPGNPECAALQQVAADWAKMSILTFDGKLLDLALDISKAVAKFTMELGTPGSTDK